MIEQAIRMAIGTGMMGSLYENGKTHDGSEHGLPEGTVCTRPQHVADYIEQPLEDVQPALETLATEGTIVLGSDESGYYLYVPVV